MSDRLSQGLSVMATVFFVLLVIGLGVWFMIQANGLIILEDPLRIVKTSTLSLEVSPRDDLTIEINGAPQATNERVFQHLTPGHYTVRITKEGYHPWERTVELLPGRAAVFEKLKLFFETPTITPLIDSVVQAKYDRLLANQSRFQNHLQIIDNELWADDLLVTRYSQPIREAVWYIEDVYVLVVVDQSIRLVDLTGTYDLELGKIDVPITDAVSLVPTNGGEDLVVKSSDLFELWKITERDPFLRLPSFNSEVDSVELPREE